MIIIKVLGGWIHGSRKKIAAKMAFNEKLQQ